MNKAACRNTAGREEQEREVRMLKYTIGIDGMMCTMCEAHITETLRKSLGVQNIKASHSKGQATFTTETPISDEQIHAAIDPTGYTVTAVSSEPCEKKGLFGFLKK